jgi:hypothetical protein|tara:strand:- start:311 stop:646 length:336 start_codon:yes stop_codon:yes gene_type:complete
MANCNIYVSKLAVFVAGPPRSDTVVSLQTPYYSLREVLDVSGASEPGARAMKFDDDDVWDAVMHRRRLRHGFSLLRRGGGGADSLLYALLDIAVDRFRPVANELMLTKDIL